jgi:hypothetical protein
MAAENSTKAFDVQILPPMSQSEERRREGAPRLVKSTDCGVLTRKPLLTAWLRLNFWRDAEWRLLNTVRLLAQVPLCHSLALSSVDVQLRLVPELHAVAITARAKTIGQTGTRHKVHGRSSRQCCISVTCKSVQAVTFWALRLKRGTLRTHCHAVHMLLDQTAQPELHALD